MHKIERAIDVGERHLMGDQWINLNLFIHVPIDNLWDVGAAARPTKSRAFPDPSGDQLEWASGNFSTRCGNADDDRHSPPLVTALQRLAHHLHVPDALETNSLRPLW